MPKSDGLLILAGTRILSMAPWQTCSDSTWFQSDVGIAEGPMCTGVVCMGDPKTIMVIVYIESLGCIPITLAFRTRTSSPNMVIGFRWLRQYLDALLPKFEEPKCQMHVFVTPEYQWADHLSVQVTTFQEYKPEIWTGAAAVFDVPSVEMQCGELDSVPRLDSARQKVLSDCVEEAGVSGLARRQIMEEVSLMKVMDGTIKMDLPPEEAKLQEKLQLLPLVVRYFQTDPFFEEEEDGQLYPDGWQTSVVETAPMPREQFDVDGVLPPGTLCTIRHGKVQRDKAPIVKQVTIDEDCNIDLYIDHHGAFLSRDPRCIAIHSNAASVAMCILMEAPVTGMGRPGDIEANAIHDFMALLWHFDCEGKVLGDSERFFGHLFHLVCPCHRQGWSVTVFLQCGLMDNMRTEIESVLQKLPLCDVRVVGSDRQMVFDVQHGFVHTAQPDFPATKEWQAVVPTITEWSLDRLRMYWERKRSKWMIH